MNWQVVQAWSVATLGMLHYMQSEPEKSGILFGLLPFNSQIVAGYLHKETFYYLFLLKPVYGKKEFKRYRNLINITLIHLCGI